MAIIRSTYHSRLSALSTQTRRIGDTMARAQLEASSGLKVMRASDAPGRMSYIHSVRESKADQSEYQSNADWAFQHLSVADGALGGLSAVISDARELAVQMSSETYNTTTRIQTQSEATALFERAVMFANTNLGGRYVFAGQAYDSEAYDASTGAYLGDTGEPEVAVADGGVSVLTGFDGSNLLQGSGDVITALQNLEAALATGVATNVQATIDDLDAAMEQVAVARTVVGGEMQRSDDGRAMAETMAIALSSQESDMVDADAVESFTNLFEVQQAFEAALQVTANARSSLLFSRL
jgi:flagellin-like hook-associated protein FlgL